MYLVYRRDTWKFNAVDRIYRKEKQNSRQIAQFIKTKTENIEFRQLTHIQRERKRERDRVSHWKVSWVIRMELKRNGKWNAINHP